MTTSIKLNKTAINTFNSLQFIEQGFAKSAAPIEETTSSLSLGKRHKGQDNPNG